MDPECNFTFISEGHQQPGRPASNLFVNFVAVPHHESTPDYHITSKYSRFKQDLFYKKEITLQDAINCRPAKIPLLDGRSVMLSNDQVITPKTIKKIEGEGMPAYDRKDYDGTKQLNRGDLYVSFDIIFPK